MLSPFQGLISNIFNFIFVESCEQLWQILKKRKTWNRTVADAI